MQPATVTKGELAGQLLTRREREITQLSAEGRTTKDVAHQLGITAETAETRRAAIMSKLRLHNVAELVRYAIRNGITEV